MTREVAIHRLHENQAELRRLGVEHLYLFGSVVRGEAREDSDIDLFFDHPEGSIGLLQLMDIKESAARGLGRKADITTCRRRNPLLNQRIEASGLQLF